MKPVEELHAAARMLRAAATADEPVGLCEDCGVRADPEPHTAALLATREPLATWLDAVASGWEQAPTLSDRAHAAHPALAVARAILGEAP